MISNKIHPLWKRTRKGLVNLSDVEFPGKDLDAIRRSVNDLTVDVPQKDNLKSVKCRVEGNEFLEQKKYRSAMAKYNQSLCYSKYSSDLAALTFIRRAECFYKLNLPTLAVNDLCTILNWMIPTHLALKVRTLIDECLDLEMNTAKYSQHLINTIPVSLPDKEYTPYLSEEDDKDVMYEGIPHSVKLNRNMDWGAKLVATRDINANEVIMHEKPFSFVGRDYNDTKYRRCAQCFATFMNFIPCKSCVFAMFCNDICEKNSGKGAHAYECKMKRFQKPVCTYTEKQFQLVMATVYHMQESFRTFSKMKRFVSDVVFRTPEHEAIYTSSPQILRTLQLLKININTDLFSEHELGELLKLTFKSYYALRKIDELHQKFSNRHQRIFLKHLVLHVVHLTQQAAIDINDLNVEVESFREVSLQEYGLGMYPIASSMNHSCLPNVFCYSVGNYLITISIRPIRQGEQICRSYINGSTILRQKEYPKSKRFYRTLDSTYKIEYCACRLCGVDACPDPPYVINSAIDQTIQNVFHNTMEGFFNRPSRERKDLVNAAFSCMEQVCYPTWETLRLEMFIHYYLMLTTKHVTPENPDF
ncbi:SET and MYND domain-containing protein 4 [Pseudolycoriella hygida]|uniref:SET and MYND domain-containing protein 4 n=1 Tax=Pseudolycoriella hygida TaxID=35572 RepID=A0A9Q0MNQ7_9DIPT|nr:SET and MYND domain-containing protein 4 [Pseudolycoriella hygida]